MKRSASVRFAVCIAPLTLLMLFITGCAVLAGHQNPDGTVSRGILDYVGEIATAAGSFIPGLGILTGLGGAVSTIAVAVRGKQWKTAATSTIKAVEEFKTTPVGARVWDDLKEKLETSHRVSKVKATVDKVLGNKKA